MSDTPVTLWERETEGWPYDGSQTRLLWSPGAGFVRDWTSRHIDADGERGERTALSTGDALRQLRDAGCYLEALAAHLGPLLETAAPVDGDPSGELRELDGVRLRRTVLPPEPPGLLRQLADAVRGAAPDDAPAVVWSWA